MINRIGKLVILVFLLVAVFSLSKNIINLIKKGLSIKQEQQELQQLEQENQQLKAELDYIQTEQFLEKEARNNLGLTKGEVVIVLPSDFYEEAPAESQEELPAWKKWWELICGRGRI